MIALQQIAEPFEDGAAAEALGVWPELGCFLGWSRMRVASMSVRCRMPPANAGSASMSISVRAGSETCTFAPPRHTVFKPMKLDAATVRSSKRALRSTGLRSRGRWVVSTQIEPKICSVSPSAQRRTSRRCSRVRTCLRPRPRVFQADVSGRRLDGYGHIRTALDPSEPTGPETRLPTCALQLRVS